VFIGVLKESQNENRVALTLGKKLNGYDFLLEKEAGIKAGYSDAAYSSYGVLLASREDVLSRSQIIFCVNCPDVKSISAMNTESILLGQLAPAKNPEAMKIILDKGITAFSIEKLPRITRAQFMDVLSSQSSLAGYQAVMLAAAQLGKTFPMMTTAAGNVAAARVLVIGAGVAGLQAIATARRLGAVVSAFDVRSSSKGEVESLGAMFVEIPNQETGDGAGGYAKEMSEAYKKAQEEKLLEVIGKQDVVITTAQIPNKPAPKIITTKMVGMMPENAVVLDLAGESGGNCELSKWGEEVVFNGRRIISPKNIINSIANTASNLFSANLIAFVKNLFKIEENKVHFDLNDELIKSSLIMRAIY
jgi:NAD(P) transhydrogenase subunit alpha